MIGRAPGHTMALSPPDGPHLAPAISAGTQLEDVAVRGVPYLTGKRKVASICWA